MYLYLTPLWDCLQQASSCPRFTVTAQDRRAQSIYLASYSHSYPPMGVVPNGRNRDLGIFLNPFSLCSSLLDLVSLSLLPEGSLSFLP